MAGKRRWRDLSPRTRKLVVGGAAAEGCLKIVALIDLARRPADRLRGPKWAWAPAIAVVNSFGIVPLSYFTVGRRR